MLGRLSRKPGCSLGDTKLPAYGDSQRWPFIIDSTYSLLQSFLFYSKVIFSILNVHNLLFLSTASSKLVFI